MTETVNLYDARTKLSQLVERAVAGEEIVIAKAGRTKAKLVARRAASERRKPAHALGLVYIADDFDAVLPDFERGRENA